MSSATPSVTSSSTTSPPDVNPTTSTPSPSTENVVKNDAVPETPNESPQPKVVPAPNGDLKKVAVATSSATPSSEVGVSRTLPIMMLPAPPVSKTASPSPLVVAKPSLVDRAKSATTTPASLSSTPPVTKNGLKTMINGRKPREKQSSVTTALSTVRPQQAMLLKQSTAIPYPGMMGTGPIYFQQAVPNPMVQFYPQHGPGVVQQFQKNLVVSNGLTPIRPASVGGPVAIAPRPVNMPTTSAGPSGSTNAKNTPKKPHAPANIRPRPIEKRPNGTTNIMPGPSNSSIIGVLQHAPNNMAMYLPANVRFAAPPIRPNGAVPNVPGAPMNAAYRMMHPGAAGIFPTTSTAMMTPGGYITYPFMNAFGASSPYVQLPNAAGTSMASTSVGAESPEIEILDVGSSIPAPTLIAEGLVADQRDEAATIVDEDENEPPPLLEASTIVEQPPPREPPPLLREPQPLRIPPPSIRVPPPPKPVIATPVAPRREAHVEKKTAPVTSVEKPTTQIAGTIKTINDKFWKEASAFSKLRRSGRTQKEKVPLKHAIGDFVIEESETPFPLVKTHADRLGQKLNPKKVSPSLKNGNKTSPQANVSPNVANDKNTVAPKQPLGRGKRKVSPTKNVKADSKSSPEQSGVSPSKKAANGTPRSAPLAQARATGRPPYSIVDEKSPSTSSKKPSTSSSLSPKKRSPRGKRVGEIEKLIGMDFGSGKSPFKTTNVSEYVKKVKKESTLLRPAVVHSYTEPDEYDDDDNDKNDDDDYESMRTASPDFTETTSPSNSSSRTRYVESDEEEFCLGCAKSFSHISRSIDYPQYCSKPCRSQYRKKKRRGRKRKSGSNLTSTTSVDDSDSEIESVPEERHVEVSPPPAKIQCIENSIERDSSSTPSVPTTESQSETPPKPVIPTPSPPKALIMALTSPIPTNEPAIPTPNAPPSVPIVAPSLNEHEKALELACLSVTNVHLWTADDVAIWVNIVTSSTTNGESFRAEEIDGSALLMLNSEHLKDSLNFRLGPALKLGKAIDWLRNTSQL